MTENIYSNIVSNFTIKYGENNFEQNLVDLFREFGVVVITDVMSKNLCDEKVSEVITNFELIGTVKHFNKNNWVDEDLPPQTRPGLFQALVSNLKPVWEIRSNDNIGNIFEILYSNLRNKNYTSNDFIVSGDGINVRPNGIEDYAKVQSDWPHCDQTKRNNPYLCIQGQMVLTNTSASFVASPKSHKIFDQIMDYYKREDGPSNWLRINDGSVNDIKKMVENIGGNWQIPIVAPAGSFIVWSSTTVHSARKAIQEELKDKNDPWKGWRCVIYVCYRPKEEFTQEELYIRQKAFFENRVTNHWGNHIFDKKPGAKMNYKNARHQLIDKYIENPEKMYDIPDFRVDLNDKQRKLINL
ncbi:MAG: hypothetical protein Terrestrivirus5_37 [Terrestrivirus sp.]|uniref:Phytanoyl-CoA dioxygenase n=1 Tax=Terrestrivirus sp. TaxID=2487775 RepID=A0A3G4ZMY2_9VIRU|nr:MAG: hypothetical protein Terrestrivirus5_37 [Terrestrivirus sp.]